VLKLKAYAKINLSLKILGLRPDGYHELESIMQSVSLCDNLTLIPIESGIEVTTNNLKLPVDKRNLAYKAAEAYFGAKGLGVGDQGVKVYIEKNIPLAAGLAGGSADAAAVLYGLNQMVDPSLRIPHSALLDLGAQIGSDVPFCLTGGNCTVKGRGEIVKRNPMTVDRSYIIVVPDIEVATKWAYDVFEQNSKSENRNTCLPAGTAKQIQNSNIQTRNDLERVVINKYPIVQKIKERLLELGCTFAQMSGSGPSVFGFPASQAMIDKIQDEFPRSYLAHSVNSGVDETAA
jgi:4-diphosphocytidyl-2-C-methyl-D-erythritol kinase